MEHAETAASEDTLALLTLTWVIFGPIAEPSPPPKPVIPWEDTQ